MVSWAQAPVSGAARARRRSSRRGADEGEEAGGVLHLLQPLVQRGAHAGASLRRICSRMLGSSIAPSSSSRNSLLMISLVRASLSAKGR